jgi:DUF971 family protein
MTKSAPTEIIYHKIGHSLEVSWQDQRFDLPAELLRVYSPSAEGEGSLGAGTSATNWQKKCRH